MTEPEINNFLKLQLKYITPPFNYLYFFLKGIMNFFVYLISLFFTNRNMKTCINHEKLETLTKSKIDNKKKPAKLSSVFSDIIKKYEKIKPRSISVMEIAREKNIQHRRLYDFFNLLTALGVCKMVQKGQLCWVGMDEIGITIKNWYANLEIQAINKGFTEIFNFGSSPSLGNLAMYFIGLYLYLNVETLSVKQAAAVFHDGKSDIRSLERRLYLVISCLEVIGMLRHSTKCGQYKLKINRQEIINYAWNVRRENALEELPIQIEGLLSRIGESFITGVYLNRSNLFSRILVTHKCL